MGRPSKHPSKVRRKQLIAKVTEAEHQRVVKEARRKKVTMSELIREAVGL